MQALQATFDHEIVPENLAFSSAGFMELPAGLHGKQQFVKVSTPWDAVPSPRLCGSGLRVPKREGDQSITSLMNGREEHFTPKGGLRATMFVYVRNQDGHPLMPCTPTKARKLLAGREGQGG